MALRVSCDVAMIDPRSTCALTRDRPGLLLAAERHAKGWVFHNCQRWGGNPGLVAHGYDLEDAGLHRGGLLGVYYPRQGWGVNIGAVSFPAVDSRSGPHWLWGDFDHLLHRAGENIRAR
jgi:hypothetical protein